MAAVKPPPGRPARLNRDAIVAVALRIIARAGPEALSVRAVAKDLGATPMALYRHVRDKDALLVLVLDALYERLPEPRLPRDPRKRLMALWTFLHDGLARWPWVVHALVRSDTVATNVLPEIEAILAASVAAGLSVEAAAQLYRVVWQYTVGELMVQQSAAGRTTPQTSTVLRQMKTAPPRFPLVAKAAPHWAALRTRSLYHLGLSALVDAALSAPH